MVVNTPGFKKIVIVGNPNVGKSVIFNHLTGGYVDVANYPGTTQQVHWGRLDGAVLIDTPGVYGLSAISPEEKLVRDLVLEADVVLNVVDAVSLQRDLFLTLQLIDAGVPVVVALNMMDEVIGRGLTVNVPLLEEKLGVPVVPTVAVVRDGLSDLVAKLKSIGAGKADPELLEEGWDEMNARHRRVREIAGAVVREEGEDFTFADRLARWMVRPSTGIPILLVTLWLMYEVVGVFFAQTVVGFTEGILMEEYCQPAVRALLSHFLELDSPLGLILAGPFGLLTMTVTYVLGLLLPLVVGFFLILSLLEDSGYMPRIAILADRVLRVIGLNGQAVIPLILGFGCVTMATITTRMLKSERERRIVIFLLALTIPCSAQLAFVTVVLTGLGFLYFVLYVVIMLGVLLGAGMVLSRFLPGHTVPLLIDLPPLRFPVSTNTWTKTWRKSCQFLSEALPIFAAGAFLLSILQVSGLLTEIQNALAPLTVGWLGLPRETANAFIMGFIRRDFGTAGILSLSLLPLQKFVALLTLTMFVPCIASTMVIIKERGWKEGLLIWAGVFGTAFFIGGLLSRICNFYIAFGEQVFFLLMVGTVLVVLAVLTSAVNSLQRKFF